MTYKTQLLSLLSITLVLALAAPAEAADPYATVGLGLSNPDSFDDSYATILSVRGGVDLNRFLAVEVEGQIGLGEREVSNEFGETDRFRTDYLLGAYGLAKLPLGESANLHLKAGYAVAGYDSSFTTRDGRTFDTRYGHEAFKGLSLGVGGQYMFGGKKRDGVRFDTYSVIDFDEDGDDGGIVTDTLTGFTLSYVRKF